MENDISWSEMTSTLGSGEPGDTPQPRNPRKTPLPRVVAQRLFLVFKTVQNKGNSLVLHCVALTAHITAIEKVAVSSTT